MAIAELARGVDRLFGGPSAEARRRAELVANLGPQLREIAQLQPYCFRGEINYSSATLPDSLWDMQGSLIGLVLGLGQDNSQLGPIAVSLLPTSDRRKKEQRLFLRRGPTSVEYTFDEQFNSTGIVIRGGRDRGRMDLIPSEGNWMVQNVLGTVLRDLRNARSTWSEDLSAKAREYAAQLDRTVHPLASLAVGSMIEAVRQRFPEQYPLQIYALPTVKEGEQGQPAVRLLLTQIQITEDVARGFGNALKASGIGKALTAAGENLLIQADHRQHGLGMSPDSGHRALALTVTDWTDSAKGFTVEMRNPALDTDSLGRTKRISAMVQDDFGRFLSGGDRPGFYLETVHPGFESIPEKVSYAAENLVLLWSQDKAPQPIKEAAVVR